MRKVSLSRLFTYNFLQCPGQLHDKQDICYILNRINVSFQISWCVHMHGSFVEGGDLIVPPIGSQPTTLRVGANENRKSADDIKVYISAV